MPSSSLYLFLIASLVSVVTCQTDEENTDYLLYTASMDEFNAAKTNPIYSNLTFETDGCSGVADKPLGFDFKFSCNRHDFGWRNYKKQGRINQAQKVNENFEKDMMNVCNGVSTSVRSRTTSLNKLQDAGDIDAMIDYAQGDETYNSGTGYYCDYDPYTQIWTANCQYYDANANADTPTSMYDTSDSSLVTRSSDSDYNYSTNSVCSVIAHAYVTGVEVAGVFENAAGKDGLENMMGVYGAFFGVLVFFYWR